MSIQKAKRLLDRLRVRTEARGAAAEAAQAAEFAERIAKRYGLGVGDVPDETSHMMREKRLPKWANVLLWAIDERFGITTKYKTGGGRPVEVVFTGPEHLTGVAVWLFKAIRKDLDDKSFIAAGAMGKVGGDRIRFRNQFRLAAAWQLHERLNPPPPQTKEQIAETKAKVEQEVKKILDKPGGIVKFCDDAFARKYGAECGRKIAIDTSVLPAVEQAKLT